MRCRLRNLAAFENSKTACSNRRCFGCEKDLFFQLMQDQPIKKSFFSAQQIPISHRTQTNVQQPFLNSTCRCKLAVQQPFFETSQSCVSTKATLSHRFKSSPSIPGKVALSGAAGYMMTAGHFRENHVSSGDLNRPPESRGSQTSGVLLVLFVQAKRINSFSLQRTSRFCEPRFSSPQWRLRTNKIKTFPKRASRFSKPRSSPPKHQLLTNKIKSFCRSAAFQGGIAAKRVPCRERFHTFC